MTAQEIKNTAAAMALLVVLGLCNNSVAAGISGRGHRFNDTPQPSQRHAAYQVERLRRIMVPLIRATNHPDRVNELRIRIVENESVNAGSAGGGQFVVTAALLERANDEQLRGVLAHEIAHDDLGHASKLQLLTAGLGIGAALLEQLFPGSGALAPLAGNLIVGNYTRPQELEADRHAVTILRRAGYSKNVMIGALNWIMRVEGNNGGGFLSTHPATNERIQALRRL
ncbi:MAG: M48 family metallopeptidase [Candidatus Binatia bacterium]